MLRLGRPWSVGVAALMLFSACSGSATPSPVPQATAAPATGAPATAAPAPATAAPSTAPAFNGTKSFIFAYPSAFGFSDAPIRSAIQQLNAQGWNIQEVEMANSDLGITGVLSGQFAATFGSANQSLAAAQAEKTKDGVSKLVFVGDHAGNSWIIEAKSSIKTCADLNGKKFAVNSMGGASAQMVMFWIKQTCPAAKPNYVIVSGSPARAAALLAGQLDASVLELADVYWLEGQKAGAFGTVENLAAALPKLHQDLITMNEDWVKANPDTVRTFLKTLILEFRKVDADPSGAYLSQIVNTFVPQPDPALVQAIAGKYIALNFYDPNGGLTQDSAQFDIDFFTETGFIKPGLTVADIADFGPINDVLAEIGKK